MKPEARRPEESFRAYDAFVQFLGLGGQRTLTKLEAKTGISVGSLKRWSRENDWMSRAAEYDEVVAREVLKSLGALRKRQMKATWMATTEKLEALAPAALKELETQLTEGETPTIRGRAAKDLLDRFAPTSKKREQKHILANESAAKGLLTKILAVITEETSPEVTATIQQRIEGLLSEVPAA